MVIAAAKDSSTHANTGTMSAAELLGVVRSQAQMIATQTEQIADIPERQRLFAAAKTPLRRLARPEDVAGAVAYLASSRADYLTGETIRVNGGQVMR